MARLEMESVDLATIGGRPLSTDVFFELGVMYASGRDVEIDLVSAHKWFNLAAMGGNQAAKDYRAELAHEMPKADQAKALRAAREWKTLN